MIRTCPILAFVLLLLPSCLQRVQEEGGRCDPDHPCPTNLRCVSNRCVERRAGLGCNSTDDCVLGVCHPEARVCVSCVDDEDCAAGVCHPDAFLCVACVTDNDCGSLRCDTDHHICRGCRVDAQCPEGWCERSTGICVGSAMSGATLGIR